VKICREAPNLVESDKKIPDNLHGILLVMTTYIRHKELLCNTLYCWQMTVAQHYTQNVSLCCHCNSGHANAKQCYVVRTLPILCFIRKFQTFRRLVVLYLPMWYRSIVQGRDKIYTRYYALVQISTVKVAVYCSSTGEKCGLPSNTRNESSGLW